MSTTQERIEFRKKNWKQFGKGSGKTLTSLGEEVQMEIIKKPLISTELYDLWDNDKKREYNSDKHLQKNNRKKFNWTIHHDVYHSTFFAVHVPNDDDELPSLGWDWADDKNLIDEFFKTIKNINLVKEYNEKHMERRHKVFGEGRCGTPPPEEIEEPTVYAPISNKLIKNQIDKTNLIVFNLDRGITNAVMFKHFSKCGRIKKVNVMTDKATGKSRGFGFVNTYSAAVAEKIIEQCHKKPLGHTIITVQYADDKKKR